MQERGKKYLFYEKRRNSNYNLFFNFNEINTHKRDSTLVSAYIGNDLIK